MVNHAVIDQACGILMKLSRRSPGRKLLVRLSQNTNINAHVVAEAILAYAQGRAPRRRAPRRWGADTRSRTGHRGGHDGRDRIAGGPAARNSITRRGWLWSIILSLD